MTTKTRGHNHPYHACQTWNSCDRPVDTSAPGNKAGLYGADVTDARYVAAPRLLGFIMRLLDIYSNSDDIHLFRNELYIVF